MPSLGFPLYHGTSTLFLDGIARHGLGGFDPVADLKVVECAKRILPLLEANCERSEALSRMSPAFELMARQVGGGMNFQHGQTYLSPSRQTAINYACRKPKGSEIITYTLEAAAELMRLGLSREVDALAMDFGALFNLMGVAAAPVLVEVRDDGELPLVTEAGEEPSASVAFIREVKEQFPEMHESICSQKNFRLTRPVAPSSLRAYLVLISRPQFVYSEHMLMEVRLDSRFHPPYAHR